MKYTLSIVKYNIKASSLHAVNKLIAQRHGNPDNPDNPDNPRIYIRRIYIQNKEGMQRICELFDSCDWLCAD
jgi:hypothetical protein